MMHPSVCGVFLSLGVVQHYQNMTDETGVTKSGSTRKKSKGYNPSDWKN